MSGKYIPTTEEVRAAAFRNIGGDWFDAWLCEHEAALIEGLADEVNVTRNEPGLVRLDVKYAGYYTGIRSGLEGLETVLREKARQRREEADGAQGSEM